MDSREMDSSVLSNLLKEYLLTSAPSVRKELALKIKNISGYEGMPELYVLEESNRLDTSVLNSDTRIIDSKLNRLLPGTKREDFPVFILADTEIHETDDIESKCEEILQSRKTELYGQTYNYDVTFLLAIPKGVPPFQWYFCILKEILRDCQLLTEIVQLDGCGEHCDRMNATDDIEYLCSCHPKTLKCKALDYYYHNLNYSTLRIYSLESILRDSSKKTQDIKKEMSFILRRLYRLYLHAFYQHFSAFREQEAKNHVYEKFYSFVTGAGLLSEKDMRPFLSVDDMKSYIYGN